MGHVKNRLMEQWDSGYSLDLSKDFFAVCPGCIRDDSLRRFVAGNGPIEQCDFCGGDGPQGIGLGDLFDYMGARIQVEWDLAVNELFWESREGGWQAPDGVVVDSDDLLNHLEEPLANEELRQTFVDAFQNDWVSRHAFRLAHHERLAYGWETFSRFVKEESRYLFLRTGRGPQGDEELIPPAQLLDEVGMAIENGGLIRRLPEGSQVVRARQHSADQILATPGELGSPPPECAPANRMSPPGISMFYGAEDIDTALAELRPEALPRLATVGAWVTARPLRFLDLVDVDVPSVFDIVGKPQRPWLRFLARFAREVSKPASLGGAAVDYVPTQVFTEYVRHVLGDPDDPVRGIRYASAVRPGRSSWVLFVDASGCTETAPGWETDHGHWLALQPTSLRRFKLTQSWTETT